MDDIPTNSEVGGNWQAICNLKKTYRTSQAISLDQTGNFSSKLGIVLLEPAISIEIIQGWVRDWHKVPNQSQKVI